MGVPDPYQGETVKAFVVLKEKEEATAEEVIEFRQKNMGAYKIPTLVRFCADSRGIPYRPMM